MTISPLFLELHQEYLRMGQILTGSIQAINTRIIRLHGSTSAKDFMGLNPQHTFLNHTVEDDNDKDGGSDEDDIVTCYQDSFSSRVGQEIITSPSTTGSDSTTSTSSLSGGGAAASTTTSGAAPSDSAPTTAQGGTTPSSSLSSAFTSAAPSSTVTNYIYPGDGRYRVLAIFYSPNHDLLRGTSDPSTVADVEDCLDYCGDEEYAGVQDSGQCYCDSVLNTSTSQQLSDYSQASGTCPGNPDQYCGSQNYIVVYQLNTTSSTTSATSSAAALSSSGSSGAAASTFTSGPSAAASSSSLSSATGPIITTSGAAASSTTAETASPSSAAASSGQSGVSSGQSSPAAASSSSSSQSDESIPSASGSTLQLRRPDIKIAGLKDASLRLSQKSPAINWASVLLPRFGSQKSNAATYISSSALASKTRESAGVKTPDQVATSTVGTATPATSLSTSTSIQGVSLGTNPRTTMVTADTLQSSITPEITTVDDTSSRPSMPLPSPSPVAPMTGLTSSSGSSTLTPSTTAETAISSNEDMLNPSSTSPSAADNPMTSNQSPSSIAPGNSGETAASEVGSSTTSVENFSLSISGSSAGGSDATEAGTGDDTRKPSSFAPTAASTLMTRTLTSAEPVASTSAPGLHILLTIQPDEGPNRKRQLLPRSVTGDQFIASSATSSSPITDCREATIFNLSQGELFAGTHIISTDASRAFQVLNAAGTDAQEAEGDITTTFHLQNGFLLWTSAAFVDHNACFCQTASGLVYILFRGRPGPATSYPGACALVRLGVVPAASCQNGIIVSNSPSPTRYSNSGGSINSGSGDGMSFGSGSGTSPNRPSKLFATPQPGLQCIAETWSYRSGETTFLGMEMSPAPMTHTRGLSTQMRVQKRV
ncbi:MAG: hypothetical protein M1818_002569 [Claussenomyces sp. TS43310]|nr:MAG: hypothetical protein M1818_002569 [Claussenomyces sp. TS43310]